MSVQPSCSEVARRLEVLRVILDDIESGRRIKLPDFDPATSKPSEFALLTVGSSPNPYNGTYRQFRYQFEGEEDLLHLIVTRQDEQNLTVEEGQEVAGFVLDGVPKALIWLKPGRFSQHFYVGHDDLIGNINLNKIVS